MCADRYGPSLWMFPSLQALARASSARALRAVSFCPRDQTGGRRNRGENTPSDETEPRAAPALIRVMFPVSTEGFTLPDTLPSSWVQEERRDALWTLLDAGYFQGVSVMAGLGRDPGKKTGQFWGEVVGSVTSSPHAVTDRIFPRDKSSTPFHNTFVTQNLRAACSQHLPVCSEREPPAPLCPRALPMRGTTEELGSEEPDRRQAGARCPAGHKRSWKHSRVGERQRVLVTEDSFDSQYYVAHNKYYEQVLVPKQPEFKGQMITVDIYDSGKHFMRGRMVKDTAVISPSISRPLQKGEVSGLAQVRPAVPRLEAEACARGAVKGRGQGRGHDMGFASRCVPSGAEKVAFAREDPGEGVWFAHEQPSLQQEEGGTHLSRLICHPTVNLEKNWSVGEFRNPFQHSSEPNRSKRALSHYPDPSRPCVPLSQPFQALSRYPNPSRPCPVIPTLPGPVPLSQPFQALCPTILTLPGPVLLSQPFQALSHYPNPSRPCPTILTLPGPVPLSRPFQALSRYPDPSRPCPVIPTLPGPVPLSQPFQAPCPTIPSLPGDWTNCGVFWDPELKGSCQSGVLAPSTLIGRWWRRADEGLKVLSAGLALLAVALLFVFESLQR
ncbi:hypothetical protein P4O66_001280 [Electrophorus voltai]|uniref:TRAM domain-containing protein n=1 Tax=Electrophorus voltai TaxID=2609070 RepID=A0AAD8ZB45_9TELE|nr:hypothetical protein P4O66_001280 [Electrophorus voltai]